MSLLDHSFHDFDIEQWLSNFNELTEPEYLLRSLDELVMTPDSAELRAILKKDNKDSTYDKIVNTLKEQEMGQLFLWALRPQDFVKDTEIVVDDDRYIKFLSELIPGYILFVNQWDRNQFGKEIRNFITNPPQPNPKVNTRLKKCSACGYDITDLFAIRLTADNILDNTPVSVVCPHCNLLNYITY
jgi:hypothetical protein